VLPLPELAFGFASVLLMNGFVVAIINSSYSFVKPIDCQKNGRFLSTIARLYPAFSSKSTANLVKFIEPCSFWKFFLAYFLRCGL
jgi:hypothetical protein